MRNQFTVSFTLDRHYHMRVLTAADVCAEYVGWLNDPERVHFIEGVTAGDVTSATQCTYVQHIYEHPHNILFGLFDGNRLIGTAGVQGCGDSSVETYLGIFIGPVDYLGKGLGTAFVRVVSGGVLKAGLAEGINAGVHTLNVTSMRVFEKCGFAHIDERQTDNGRFHYFRATKNHLVVADKLGVCNLHYSFLACN